MTALPELLGESSAIEAVKAEIDQFLGSDTHRRRVPPVLIEGETGTGKGLLARLLHAKSVRRDGPFVEINCAAIPAHLLEAELFGFERGAFTDARNAKPGLFEVANHGIIFLDEISLLAKDLQGKVLTVVESGTVRRIGSTRTEPVDIWIVAASNENLLAAARDHRFREDLYHRLAVLTLRLPPLRERARDVLVLAEHFLQRACTEYEISPKQFAPEASDRLLAYPWPGNVRELRNVIERTALLSRSPVIVPAELRLPVVDSLPAGAHETVEETSGDPELTLLTRALEQTSWNVSRTAAQLGISRNTLRHRIAKYGLVPPVSAPFRRGGRHELRKSTRPLPQTGVSDSKAERAVDEIRYEHRVLGFLRIAAEPSDISSRIVDVVEKVSMYGGRVVERGSSGILAVFGFGAGENPVLAAAFAAMAIVGRAKKSAVGDTGEGKACALIIARDCPIVWTEGAPQVDIDAKFAAWQALNKMLSAASVAPILVHMSATPFLERRLELRTLDNRDDAVHELTGQAAGPFRRSGQVVPLVGREHEMAFLKSAYATVIRGTGRTVAMVGEPGVGKSRILFELRRHLSGEAATIIDVRCHAHAMKLPYLLVIEMLRQLFGIDATMDRALAVERVRRSLQENDADHLGGAAHLYELLGLRDHPTSPTPYNAEPRILQVMQQVFQRWSRRQPMVLLIDDVQWADKASERCIAGIAGTLDLTPLLLVATHRPGSRPPWTSAAYSTELAVPPLSGAETHALLRLLATRELPEASKARIVEIADGNPFFLEELVRAVPEGLEDTGELSLPATVQEAVLGRIDQLDHDPRQVLQVHAVFGRSVAVRVLEAVLRTADVKAALDVLIEDQLLIEDLQADEPTYRLKHVLTQQVVYDSLSVAERAALHGVVGNALERVYSDRLELVADGLAYHYLKAGIADRALTYVTLLADSASRRHDHLVALDALDEALRLAKSDTREIDDRDRVIVGLVIRRARSMHFLGAFAEILEILLEHRPEAERVGDATLEAEFYFLLARNYGMLGRSQEATAAAADAIAAAQAAADASLLGRAYYVLALEFSWLGRCVESIAHASRAVELLQSVGDHSWQGQADWVLGFSHGLLGEIDAALGAEAQARTLARCVGDIRLESYTDWTSGFIYACIGRSREAIEHCERALQAALDPHNIAIARGFLGYAYLQRGDIAQARELLEEAVRETRASGFARFYASVCTWLAEALLRQKDTGRASRLAEEALNAAQQSGHIVGEGWARRAIAMIAYAHDRLPEAEANMHEALRVFSSIPAPLETARTLLALAEIATARGQTDVAAAYLNDARRSLMVPALAEHCDYVWERVGPEWGRVMQALRDTGI